MIASALVAAAGSAILVAPAWAQDAATVQRAFAIPSGPLPDAIVLFSRQSGLQVTADAGMMAGRSAGAISGAYAPAEALSRLLAGSGLTYTFVGPNAVALEPAPRAAQGAVQLGPVRVQGSAAGAAAAPSTPPPQAIIGALPPAYTGGQVAAGGQLGLLGERDVMDTPFSLLSYTSQTIQDQQARSVVDILAGNDPSVRGALSGLGSVEPVYIRGLYVGSADFAYDGLFGILPTEASAPEFAERIEILNGPSALLNGMPPGGSIGGTVNIIPKRATDAPITRFSADYGSDAQFGGHFDVGRRFGQDNEFGVRLSGTYQDGDTPIDRNSRQLGATALDLDYRGHNARFSLDLGYQNEDVQSPTHIVSVLAGVPTPSAPSASANFTQPWSNASADDKFVAARGEIDLTPHWTLFAAAGAKQDYTYYLWSTPQVSSTSGAFSESPFEYDSSVENNTQQVGLRGQFDTGPLQHRVNVSADRLWTETDYAETVFQTIKSNLYTPNFVSAPALTRYGSLPKSSDTELHGVGVADAISALDDRVQLTAGFRQQYIVANGYNTSTGARTSHYSDSKLSPAVAVVVKPWRNVSLYANYIEGLQQGSVAPAGAANVGQVFAPFVSKQYETGVKVDFGKLTATLAAFQIEQPSTFTDPATLVFSESGQQRNRGIELNTFGQITDAVRVLGGVSYIDAVLTRTAGGAYDGDTAPSVPHVQLNLGGEWDTPFISGLTLTGRVIYTSSWYIDTANTRQAPEWTRFDVGAHYRFTSWGKPMTVRLNVENLFDRSYWQAASGGLLLLAPPRTVLLSTSVDF